MDDTNLVFDLSLTQGLLNSCPLSSIHLLTTKKYKMSSRGIKRFQLFLYKPHFEPTMTGQPVCIVRIC